MAKKTKARFPASLEEFLGTRPVSILLSFLTALIIWFAIVTNVYSTAPMRFNNIPVKVELTGTNAEANGLSVVDFDVETVNVELIGDRSQIGLLTAEDLVAYADVGGISSSGQFTLDLNVRTDKNIGFSVASITPAITNVKLDWIETQSFAVEPSFPNIKVSSGHVLDREDVVCDPPTIELTGPSAQLAEIGRVVVSADKTAEISSSYSLYSNDVKLYTTDGALLDAEQIEIPSVDFQISIPILTQKELELTYELIGIPSGFDEEWLRERLKLSESSITLASQTSSAFAKNDSQLNVGFVRLSEIGLEYSTTLDIELEDIYTNQSNIQQVTLTLDSEGLSSRSFTVSTDNIKITNQPTNYNFDLVTKRLDITVVGDKEVLDKLDADDILVTVDLLDYDVDQYPSESFTRPASISFYQQGKVWAVGSYRIALDRSEIRTPSVDET
jgi:YbbR domain-containing protein